MTITERADEAKKKVSQMLADITSVLTDDEIKNVREKAGVVHNTYKSYVSGNISNMQTAYDIINAAEAEILKRELILK